MGLSTQTNSSSLKSPPTKKNKGGRPKTPWTPSLKRKLIRLYTLTSLSKLEISKAIRQDGFAPSESDIQKKLRLLLPNSYAKDHRSFRPRDEENMLKRFSTLQICNRKQKRERLRARTRRRATTNTFSRDAVTKRDELDFEEHPAFRNYASSSTAEEVIRPSEIQDSMKPKEIHKSVVSRQKYTPEPSTKLDGELSTTTLSLKTPKLLMPPVCQIANPCLVMLDGSYIFSADKKESEKTKSVLTQNSEFQQPEVKAKPTSKVEPSAAPKTAHATVSSLQERINGKHTRSYLEHVSSVINYSVPSSKNSSIMSWTSRISSFGSRVSTTLSTKGTRGEESYHDRVRSGYSMNTSPRPIPIPTQGEDDKKGWVYRPSTPTKPILSMGEEDIWNEFIDVSHVSDPGTVSAASRGNFYSPFSILSRKCCKSPQGDSIESQTPTCRLCGTRNTHRLLATGITKITHVSSFLKEASVLLHSQDYYGNTPLHAAGAHGNIRVLIDFVENWRNIPDSYQVASQTNTSGENFLHVIQLNGFTDFLRYCELIKILKRECPGGENLISKRDYRGRTILHPLMQSIPEELFSDDLVDQLCTIFPQTSIPSYAVDNQGMTLRQVIESRIFFATSHHLSCRQIISKLQLESETTRSPIPSHKTFFNSLPTSCDNEKLTSQFHGKARKDINWVDNEGETPLIAIISHPLHTSEPQIETFIPRLLALGADIHSRDRNGNTALCFAVKRGFRAISKILLEAGANPRCYNYAGVDILSRATQWMNSVTEDENAEILHSSIYNCILLLIDYGAKLDPSGLDEWMTPTGKKEFGRAMKVKSDKQYKSDNKIKNLKGILKNRRVEALAEGSRTVWSEKTEKGMFDFENDLGFRVW